MAHQDLELSPDQKSALTTLMDWWKDHSSKPVITLGGYAGCGKTTIVSVFRELLWDEDSSLKVAFCAFTGKAAHVMKTKLYQNVLKEVIEGDTCGTIHSLMYEPVIDSNTGEVTDWIRVPRIPADLIIVDEASMVTSQMFTDLTSYGIPILAVGDHGQLPPVDSAKFNLMENPDIKLETLHRFAEKDGLIKASMMARVDGYIPFGNINDQVFKVHTKDPIVAQFIRQRIRDFSDGIILCGFNKTRIKMNRQIRAKLFNNIDDSLAVHDKVVCLKNNKNAQGCPIFNGMIGEVIQKYTLPGCYDVRIKFNDESFPYKGAISDEFCAEKPDMGRFIIYKNLRMFRKAKGIGDYYSVSNVIRPDNSKVYLDNFDYGYCITVHKSQGSEWGNVAVLEEQAGYWSSGEMWRRWLYTAVTRAREKLLIVSNSVK